MVLHQVRLLRMGEPCRGQHQRHALPRRRSGLTRGPVRSSPQTPAQPVAPPSRSRRPDPHRVRGGGAPGAAPSERGAATAGSATLATVAFKRPAVTTTPAPPPPPAPEPPRFTGQSLQAFLQEFEGSGRSCPVTAPPSAWPSSASTITTPSKAGRTAAPAPRISGL